MLRAKEGFSYDVKGVPVVVPAGAIRPANHSDVKGRESLFESVDAVADRQHETGTYSAAVEQATAAPGEHRQLSGQSRR
jgi:hypothetical protein